MTDTARRQYAQRRRDNSKDDGEGDGKDGGKDNDNGDGGRTTVALRRRGGQAKRPAKTARRSEGKDSA